MIRRHRTVLFGLLSAALLITAVLVLSAQGPAHAAVIDPRVYDDLAAAADGQARFLVLFEDRANLSDAAKITDWSERGRAVVERLRDVADRSQAGALTRLAARTLPGHITAYQSFWIANVIAVTGDRTAAEALARLPGVAEILPELKLDAPEPPEASTAPDADDTWGIEKIGANQVWSTYNITGTNSVIGLVDTGVQWDHIALKGQYRGWDGSSADHNYNWWDPAHFCGAFGTAPCDSQSHGTHTTGIAAGGTSALQGPIGVAPGAKWIHAAGCCASNDSLLSALQWMAAPTDLYGLNPDPSKRPNVVNNSWGGPGGSKIFYDAIAGLRAAGIVPVFSAGNSGSACGTLGSPGDNTVSFNVGSTTSTDGVSSFSSRGSNPFTGLPDPEVTAPGSSIYSSIPTDPYYGLKSGTSMAAPHVTGAVALILSAEPDLVGKVDQVEELLRKTAVWLTSTQSCGGVSGSQTPNNTFGWGRINVKAAVDFVWHAGTLSGVVTDAGTGQPIAGATVSIIRNGYTITQKTDALGAYSFVAGAGSYDMTVAAFGYNAASAAAVAVGENGTTTRDFALGALTTGSISGTVLQSDSSAPVLGATISLAGSSLSATTAADGAYTLANVPFGSHSVRMTAPGYATLTSAVTVDGAETLNFTPATAPDYIVGDGGDTCSADYAWIDATSGTARSLGDDNYMNITLPWLFPFYGNNYSSFYISSNGFISFGTGYSTWHGVIPFEGIPNNQVIGLGDDLNPASGAQGMIYTRDLGDGRFVVEFHQVQHWYSGYPETFEIILNNNDDTILVQYNTVSWPDFSNAGIENANGSRGILYASGLPTPLHDGLAVKYTPFSGQAPICSPAVAPILSVAKNGATADLIWQHLSPNTSYEIWRGDAPYFLPPGDGALVGTPVATPGAMTYPDAGMVGDPLTNHFWVVQGVLAGGASGASNRVGEFDFSLTRGD